MTIGDEKKVDILVPSQEPHVRSILLHTMALPNDARKALLANGIVAIKVANLADVRLVPVPLVISFDGEVLKATERLALETIMEHKASDQIGVRTKFGMKMLAQLLKNQPQK